MPLTSKDTDSQGKGDNRAKHTHTGIDITWLPRCPGIRKGPSKTAPKSNGERARELYGPLKLPPSASSQPISSGYPEKK